MNQYLVAIGLLGVTCVLCIVQITRQSQTILRYRIAEIRRNGYEGAAPDNHMPGFPGEEAP